MLLFTPPGRPCPLAAVISYGNVQNIPRYLWAAEFNDLLRLDLFDDSQRIQFNRKVQNLGCIFLAHTVTVKCYLIEHSLINWPSVTFDIRFAADVTCMAHVCS